jgi:hypothetical protein
MPGCRTSRRVFIAALSGAAAWPLAVRAQEASRVRVGLRLWLDMARQPKHPPGPPMTLGNRREPRF